MRLRNVGIVYRKELTDQLRDRRTIISMVVVPIVLFPLMTIGFAALAIRLVDKAQKEGYSIMLLGAEHAPALAEAIRQTDGIRVEPPAADYVSRINDKKLRAAVEFPPDFEAMLGQSAGDPPVVKIYHYAGELRSTFAVRTVQKTLGEYRDTVVEQRLAARQLAKEILDPFKAQEENVAPPEKVGGTQLGGFIPYFIIILCLTGAAYPAIDLTAGEKERGTIETILASPVGRTELVMGKFLMVLTASLTTTVLSLASFAATFLFASEAAQEAFRRGPKAFTFVISTKGVAAVFFMVLPLAVLFSGALLAIALLAKSYKEAQSYIQPLIIVVILPAIVALLPGVELNAKLALIPILNVSLVSKEILTGNYPWGLIGLIFGSSSLYAAAALFVAVRAFQRESVLFRT
ncbi:MAG: ABC transporter permease [Candidatus Acidiferrales bacterium]